jgi:apolipoprotein N-acyltransferase
MKSLLPALGALVSTAAFIWLGTGLAPEWPLMWIAPVPVLLYALNAGAGAAALVAGAAMMLGLTNLWSYLHGSLSVPLAILVRIYLIEGVVFALAVLLFRALARRRAYWSALLAFPAALVSFEWFLNLTSPHGTGASLAYSQLGFLPFLQLASITGPWGMSFLLLTFPTALVLASHLRKESPKQGYRVLGVTVALVVAVLSFGTVRLLSPPPAGSLVKVGLVASDGPNEHVADEGAPADQLFKDYAVRVAQLAREGATVVVLPEKTAVVVDPDIARTDHLFQSLADERHVRVVLGVLRVSPPGAGHPQKLRYNEARVYTPGQPVASYDKEHMLPPFESNLTPGTTLTLLRSSAGQGIWGVAICKDMDFTQLSRQYGAAGAGLMLVPGWDFFSDAISHGHMAIMRGVESGFGVVRSAKGGSLYVSDNRGRIMAEISSDAVPFTALMASVPETHDRTLFLSLGDWFAWVAVAILVLCLVRLAEGRPAPPVSASAPAAAPAP